MPGCLREKFVIDEIAPGKRKINKMLHLHCNLILIRLLHCS